MPWSDRVAAAAAVVGTYIGTTSGFVFGWRAPSVQHLPGCAAASARARLTISRALPAIVAQPFRSAAHGRAREAPHLRHGRALAAHAGAGEQQEGKRMDLEHYVDIVVRRLREACARTAGGRKRLLFVTGAGMSAESGLPTYRGVSGLYNQVPGCAHVCVCVCMYVCRC